MEMCERLVVARRRANFETATEAAESIGVPYPTYAGHENGSSGFRARSGMLYARKFKVRFEWLMTGVGPMTDGPGDSFDEFLRLLASASDDARQAALTTLRLGQPSVGQPSRPTAKNSRRKATRK